MVFDSDEAYYKALLALKSRDYRKAAGYLKSAENQFADSLEFRILLETTRLLLAVKEEIFDLELEEVKI